MNDLAITDAGVNTIYDLITPLNDLKVINADRVAVDLFDGASPRINDLVIDGGGQDLHGISTSWRYGMDSQLGRIQLQ